MGIIRTNEWLDQEFDRPLTIMKRLEGSFTDANPNQLYHHLQKHGMYKPNEKSKKTYKQLLERGGMGKNRTAF